MNTIQRRTTSFTDPEMCYGSRNDSTEPTMDQSTSIDIDNIPNIPNRYDNLKNIRRELSFASLVSQQAQQALIQARSPAEIISSFYNDMSWDLLRSLALSIIAFYVGVHGPKSWVLPSMGGLTWRPIPYQVTAAGDVLLDLGLANAFIPKADVTFPSARLYFLSLWAPLTILILVGGIFPLVTSLFPNNNPLHNIHSGVCTILTAIGISEFVTQVFKFYVGRLRPNFYEMCGFDKAILECTNGEDMEMEARMSFPSGHSSLSFCGMMALCLFFMGRVGLGRVARPNTLKYKFGLMLSFLPLLFSFWCATSRLVDHWHHPSDILAGSILGTVSAFIGYHLWYPHVFSVYAGVPLSVIHLNQEENTMVDSNFIPLDSL